MVQRQRRQRTGVHVKPSHGRTISIMILPTTISLLITMSLGSVVPTTAAYVPNSHAVYSSFVGRCRFSEEEAPRRLDRTVLFQQHKHNDANNRRIRQQQDVVVHNGKHQPVPVKANGRRVVDSSSTSTTKNNDWGSIPRSSELEPLGGPHPNSENQVPSQLPNGGKITLLGSGPGDPELLTVAAYRLLTQQQTDDKNPNNGVLVIADRLVSKEILDIIPTEQGVDVKVARKLPGCAELAQEEIYWWAYQGLKEGKHVIRLKIGDPFVFGRGGEEVLTFRRFGVQPKVIPGVSAAFSAPLLGNIPVTHRGVSNQVVMCTGYGREGTSPDLIRYHKEQTIVFLMAVGRLQELCQRLMDQADYPSDTPVAIVEKAGCPDQRTVAGNMMTIADIAKRHDIKPPSTIVVGDVVNVLLEKDDQTGEHVTGLIQNMTAGVLVQ